ncbi:Nif3-like dinuclear metal center hexameric protein [Virgibacillus oceani]|uniref:GTP cyclohydrolase 1 type 2 homolog n=1 Tax=Virgibacillus oceani TaxID=1479511 RepID=A0A917GZZ9_9BACI|nr:Nif3-like dinuclear metal center hexameric protein [Virgibacillus oceani]GGG63505.1 GTP cyclohydrolase 1 type 2 [Virgibacillus oceani]
MTSTIRNADVFRIMEEWAPKHLAYDWDNVGMQLGSSSKPVKKIMVTLDVLESVVDEAIENNIDLIIAHHPLFFKSTKQINTDSPQGRIIQKLILHDITVYAAHTNLDAADNGVNDMLCDILDIKSREILLESHTEKLVKVAVYVPDTHIKEVREALSDNGAGHIGNYSHCTFQTSGQGTFKPLEGTNPFIGQANEMEMVNEIKLETIVPESILPSVLDAMVKAHPYEEASYDVYPLNRKGKAYGIGRVGLLENSMTLEMFCEYVKEKLNVPKVRVTGDLSAKVSRVAVLGGSGEKYINDAFRKGADVFITGDMTFHVAQDAWQMGLSVIDPGHHVEKVMKQATKQYLDQHLSKNRVNVFVSEMNTEPFRFV